MKNCPPFDGGDGTSKNAARGYALYNHLKLQISQNMGLHHFKAACLIIEQYLKENDGFYF
jgi:hypothetical protein